MWWWDVRRIGECNVQHLNIYIHAVAQTAARVEDQSYREEGRGREGDFLLQRVKSLQSRGTKRRGQGAVASPYFGGAGRWVGGARSLARSLSFFRSFFLFLSRSLNIS